MSVSTRFLDPVVEVDEHLSVTQGAVPPEVRGALIRLGPGDFTHARHPFDGDGAVRRYDFDGTDRIRYRCRYVDTAKRRREQAADRPEARGFGTRATSRRVNLTRGGSFHTAANTNIVPMGGRLLALWEGGHPVEVDSSTLDTVGPHDFHGALRAGQTFSAHPHSDPAGPMYNFGITYGRHHTLDTYEVSRSGSLRTIDRTRIPHPVMNHDFILTERWCVYFLDPVRLRLTSFLLRGQAFGTALQWRPDLPTTVVLVPREGGASRIMETDPFFQFHFAAAFDDGDDVVVDVVRYADYRGIGRDLATLSEHHGRHITPGRLWRMRIGMDGEIGGRELSPLGVEFPTVDPRVALSGHRTVFAAVTPPAVETLQTGLAAIDVGSGAADTFDFGPGRWTSEPAFVPRPDADPEDGWLLALVYDPDRDVSDVVVLDTRNVSAGPVARITGAHNAGFTFHGGFAPGG